MNTFKNAMQSIIVQQTLMFDKLFKASGFSEETRLENMTNGFIKLSRVL